MADPKINVILTLTDKLSAGLKNISNLTKTTFGGIGNLSNVIFGSFGMITGAISGFGAGLMKLADETMQFDLSVKDMATALNISAEQASYLIAMAGDLRIEQGRLMVAFRTLSRQGISPTLDGIKQLAEEYKAIQNPVERTQFALAKFGRAGFQMTRILSMTSEEIDNMAESHKRLGLILTDESVKAAEKYYLAIDDLKDAYKGLRTTVGNEVIPTFTDVVNEFNRVIGETLLWSDVINSLDIALQQNAISVGEYKGLVDQLGKVKGPEDLASILDEVNKRMEEHKQFIMEWGTEEQQIKMTSAALKERSTLQEEMFDITSDWDKVLKLARSDEERITIATVLWGNEISETNRKLLEQEKQTLLTSLETENLSQAEAEQTQKDVALINTKLDILDLMKKTASATKDYSKVLKTARNDQEKVALATMMFGDEVDVANKKMLEYERGYIQSRLATENLTTATQDQMLADIALIDTKLDVIGVSEKLAGTYIDEAMAAETAAEYSRRMLDTVDVQLESPIKAYIDDLKWMMAGGFEIQKAFESIKNAYAMPIEQRLDLAKELLPGVYKTKVEAGLMTREEALQGLMDDLNIPLEEAQKKLDEFTSAIDLLSSEEHQVIFNLKVTGDTWILDLVGGIGKFKGKRGINPETGLPEGAFQRGTNMIVPPGYPNDSYLMGVTSGEHVQVTPAGQKAGTTNIYLTQHFNDEGAAAIGMAITRQIAAGRLNNSMGR